VKIARRQYKGGLISTFIEPSPRIKGVRTSLCGSEQKIRSTLGKGYEDDSVFESEEKNLEGPGILN